MSARRTIGDRGRRNGTGPAPRRAKASRGHPKVLFGLSPLSWGDRLDIVDALSRVLGDIYAHLPLKRSLYGFDILRGLESLRLRLPSMSDLQFHRDLTLLVNRLRDAHTQYRGPWAYSRPVASLPFLVESYGPPEDPRYVVSKVDRGSVPDPHFLPGVEIEYWNGIPLSRAVELHAECETGGRPDAQRARALESLTFRSLEYGPPPNEEWVTIDYRDRDGEAREVRLQWDGLEPLKAPEASRSAAVRARSGINPGAEAVRRAKKLRFKPELWKAERRRAGRRRLAERFADFLTARTVLTREGKMGYLRIWSFDVDDDDAFLEAVISMLRGLPDRGLIIDLRDNPGGFIWAAERMLQLFTSNRIEPTRFALRATPLTAAMARAVFNQAELAPWAESLESALQTGEPYSIHLPITPVERCNDLGQHYGGPVAVVVDANTYSSGDLFAAGFVDNRIGPVVCIGEATGAGGANVWTSDDLRAAMKAAEQPMPRLPDGASFTVAVRRAVRCNDAIGTLIEDVGIPGQPYSMTHDDVLHGNRDLIEHCAGILAAGPRTALRADVRRRSLRLETAGLDQLDVYFDGHPGCIPIRLRGRGRRRLVVPASARQIDVVGFSGGVVRQRRRLAVP